MEADALPVSWEAPIDFVETALELIFVANLRLKLVAESSEEIDLAVDVSLSTALLDDREETVNFDCVADDHP